MDRSTFDGRDSVGEESFLHGVGRTFASLTLFVGFGLIGFWVLDALASYPPAKVSEERVWLVDGFNVLHAGILEGRERSDWWRSPARARLLEVASSFEEPAADLWVVFDGPTPEREPGAAERARVVFSPSADEWLVRRVRESPNPGRLRVVTGDRSLRDRVEHKGAVAVRPREFLSRCREWKGYEPS